MNWITRKRWFLEDLLADIPYFLNAKSTTQRAYMIDKKGFKINLLRACLEKATTDEYLNLGIATNAYVWVREVELNLLSTPVMLARLVVPYFALETTFRRIKYLGDYPLGRYLFKLSSITREPFKIKKIEEDDEFYARVIPYQKKKSDEAVWARRSIFRYKTSPLLLTEIFLPQYSYIMKGNL